MNSLLSFLIICPLNFLAGLVDSIGGGGGLISLPAFMLAGLSPHAAVATNKLASTTGTSVSTARYCKNGWPFPVSYAHSSVPFWERGSSCSQAM